MCMCLSACLSVHVCEYMCVSGCVCACVCLHVQYVHRCESVPVSVCVSGWPPCPLSVLPAAVPAQGPLQQVLSGGGGLGHLPGAAPLRPCTVLRGPPSFRTFTCRVGLSARGPAVPPQPLPSAFGSRWVSFQGRSLEQHLGSVPCWLLGGWTLVRGPHGTVAEGVLRPSLTLGCRLGLTAAPGPDSLRQPRPTAPARPSPDPPLSCRRPDQLLRSRLLLMAPGGLRGRVLLGGAAAGGPPAGGRGAAVPMAAQGEAPHDRKQEAVEQQHPSASCVGGVQGGSLGALPCLWCWPGTPPLGESLVHLQAVKLG